jgi:hypothetical protein
MVDEVIRVAWQEAEELKKAAAKRPLRRGSPWTTWIPSGSAKTLRSATRRHERSSG